MIRRSTRIKAPGLESGFTWPKQLTGIARAGRYLSQPEGYRAFIPSGLPPVPAIQLAGELQRVLSEADRALGRLDGSIHTLPNPDLFVYMYVRKEAALSSQIEGTQSSLQDLLAAEAQVPDEGRPRGVDEVVNYVRAMNHGLSRLDTLPVSVRVIREIHAELLKGVRGSRLTPGELRRTQNWIGPAGATLAQATFLDGNGRVGRLLITFLLCERGALRKPVRSLSYYFQRHRQEYYDRLQSVRDAGDWEGWLGLFLRGVTEVSIQAAETARRILLLREEHRRAIADKLGRAAGNGHRVLEQLYEQPIISVKDVQALLKTTFAGANQIVQRLENIGIVREITGHTRHRRFRYDAYVQLFDDELRA